ATTSPVLEVIGGIGILLMFFYAHRRIAAGTLTTGQFVAFIAAVAAMYQPIKKLNKVNLSVNTALSAAERVFRMLDFDNDVKERSDADVVRSVGSGIRYEQVSFSYASGGQAPSPVVSPSMSSGQVGTPVLQAVD